MGKRYEAVLVHAITETEFGLVVERTIGSPWCSAAQVALMAFHEGREHNSSSDYDAILIVMPHEVYLNLRALRTAQNVRFLDAISAAMRSVGIEQPIEED